MSWRLRLCYLSCLPGMLFLFCVLGTTQSDAADSLTCPNGQAIEPAYYTVALLTDWMSSVPSTTGAPAVQVPVAVVVKTADNRLFPLMLIDRSHVLVQCGLGGPRGNGALYPVVKITPVLLTAPLLAPFLQSQMRSGELGKYDAVALRQSGSLQFLPWPAGWHYVTGAVQKLIDDYFEASASDYLTNYPNQLWIEPPRSTGKPKQVLTGGGPNPGSGNTHTSQDSSQQPDHSSDPDLHPSIQDHGAAQTQPAGPSYATPFVIGFARPEWRDIKLDNNSIRTFGYCSDQIKPDGLKYTLQCQPASDGKVQILIQGFKPISISRNEPQLDERLEFDGFRTPYPPSWGRASTDNVEVPGGRLADAIGRWYSLDQGIQGTTACTDKTSPITLAAIIQRAVLFPDPPCRRYDLAFDQAVIGPSPQIVSGCLAGGPLSVPVQNRQATCWFSKQQGASVTLQLELFPGFWYSQLPISQEKISRGRVDLSFGELAPSLRPNWPYGGPSPFENSFKTGETPRYLPETVDYTANSGTPCDPALPVTPGGPQGYQLPDLAAAHCSSVPTKARITFKQAPGNTDSPPAEAFLQSYPDEYVIANGPSGNRDPSTLKLSLPVGFSPADARDYNNKYGTGAHNSERPGVYIFPRDCSAPIDGKYVKFGEFKADKWPLKARVFDKNDEPLTACAPAKISKDGDKTYFTFSLQGTHAVGPRKVIVIAVSQALTNQSGTVPAIIEALQTLADTAYDAFNKNGAPLSPITVYSADSGGNYRILFTGEDAALNREQTRQQIGQLDRAAAPTPDFQSFRYQPGIKDNFDKVIFVMDGSSVNDENKGALSLIVNKLAKDNQNNVAFYLASSCAPWTTSEIPPFGCHQLPAEKDKKMKELKDEFNTLVTKTAASASAADRAPGTDGSPR
jgi:hypothetical protein